MHCGYFDTTQKGNHSATLTPTVVGRRRPLPSEICAQNDPAHSKNADLGLGLINGLFVMSKSVAYYSHTYYDVNETSDAIECDI